MKIYRISYVVETVHWINVKAHDETSAFQGALGQGPDCWESERTVMYQPIEVVDALSD